MSEIAEQSTGNVYERSKIRAAAEYFFCLKDATPESQEKLAKMDGIKINNSDEAQYVQQLCKKLTSEFRQNPKYNKMSARELEIMAYQEILLETIPATERPIQINLNTPTVPIRKPAEVEI